jgi:hypothetical protein
MGDTEGIKTCCWSLAASTFFLVSKGIPDEVNFGGLDTDDACYFGLNVPGKGACDGTTRRGKSHADAYIGFWVNVNIVNQTQFVNVDWNFRIVAGSQHLNDSFLEFSRCLRLAR